MREYSRTKRALSHAHAHAHAHVQWLGLAYINTGTSSMAKIYARLQPNQILLRDNDILVTEVGFVTLAVHSTHAVNCNKEVVVPGIDSEGTRGFLVMRENAIPYHSMSDCIMQACNESDCAQQRAQALVAAFGDKHTLHEAARKAPWYKWVTEQDLTASGLCAWGSDSFLKRMRLRFLARRFGLPRVCLRLAGT